MSNQAPVAQQEQATAVLADQIMELAAEQGMLRESIVTAAEWDNQARQVRQGVLDETLQSVRQWTRVLVAMVVGLLVLVVILMVLVVILLAQLKG